MSKPVALITGASRGIGRAIAEELSKTADLVLIGTNANKLEETAAECDPSANVETVCFDLVQTAKLPELIREIKAKNINILVNNAGLCIEESIYTGDLAAWEVAFDVNLKAVMHLTYLCMPLLLLSKTMHGSAAIINISSTAGQRTYAKGTNYCATKWGLMGFSGALFEDVRHDGIKVCTICPGFVNTDMHANSKLDGRLMIQPKDIARTVRFVVDFPNNACPTEITIYPQRDPRGRR